MLIRAWLIAQITYPLPGVSVAVVDGNSLSGSITRLFHLGW